MSTAGPRFTDIHRLLDERRELSSLGRALQLLVGIPIMAVVLHALVAGFLEDGVDLLANTTQAELGWIADRNPYAADRTRQWMDSSHDWLFRRSGIERFVMNGQNPVGKQFARIALRAYQGIVASVQLLTLRLGTLVTALPLIGVLIVVAVVEGVSNWYLRRQIGARESSFLYHRFKKAVKLALLALLGVYLVPPIPIDPVWVFLPFFSVTVAALAAAVSLFKKHL